LPRGKVDTTEYIG